MAETEKVKGLNVRGVPEEAINRFAAACKMQGRRMGDVIGKIMLEYADPILKRSGKK